MFDFRNINDLMGTWAQQRQYETGWEKGLKRAISNYISLLERERIEQFDSVIDFWWLFEVYLSMNLSVEWYGLNGAYQISKGITEELQYRKQTSAIISLITGDIRYAYIDRKMNWIEVTLFKGISASTIARKRSLEVVNIWEIFRDLFQKEFFDLFKTLSEYKKPNEYFAFISLNEIDQTLLNNLEVLLKEHQEKYNLGEEYVWEYLENLERFLNSMWTLTKASFNH